MHLVANETAVEGVEREVVLVAEAAVEAAVEEDVVADPAALAEAEAAAVVVGATAGSRAVPRQNASAHVDNPS